jgi:hypothetical protein
MKDMLSEKPHNDFRALSPSVRSPTSSSDLGWIPERLPPGLRRMPVTKLSPGILHSSHPMTEAAALKIFQPSWQQDKVDDSGDHHEIITFLSQRIGWLDPGRTD